MDKLFDLRCRDRQDVTLVIIERKKMLHGLHAWVFVHFWLCGQFGRLPQSGSLTLRVPSKYPQPCYATSQKPLQSKSTFQCSAAELNVRVSMGEEGGWVGG